MAWGDNDEHLLLQEQVDAQKRIADAEERVADAQERLANAYKRVADAQERIATAEEGLWQCCKNGSERAEALLETTLTNPDKSPQERFDIYDETISG